MNNFLNNFLNKFIKIFTNKDSYNLLGRWCHKGLPNCNQQVIDKKIDFALLDNNLCNKPFSKLKLNNNKTN